MARSRSALHALPPVRQRANEAYLCGTIFTGAENTRRGRSGNRRGGPGMFLPDRGERTRAGERAPAGAGSGARAVPGGEAARGFQTRGAGAPGPATPAGARARRGPHAPGRGGLRGASSLLRERGGGRAANPGPEPGADGVGAARRPRQELEQPGWLRGRAPLGRPCSGISHPACGRGVPLARPLRKSPSGLGGNASS